MRKLDALLRGVAEEQDALRAGGSVPERVASRFRRFTPRRKRRVRAWLALAAALAVATLVLGVQVFRQRTALSVSVGTSGGALLLGAWLGAPDSSSLPLVFSDGSEFELTPKSRARLVELGAARARVELASGSLRVQVVPGRAASWRIDAGSFGVNVTGTRFVVSYAPESDVLELWLEEGQVELSGCVFGASRRLAAGQHVRASCRTPRLDVSYRDALATRGEVAPPASSMSEARLTPPAVPTATSAPPPQNGVEALRESATATPQTWLSLARAGRFEEAFAAAQRDGFESECQRAAPDALTLLADTARHARAPRQAERALVILRRRFSGTSDAALAAFTLGRLAFDEFGAPAAAADWFRTYLKERPNGAMAREALGRLIEASHGAGDAATAEASSRRYLRDYPHGPHAKLAARLAAEP